ncbi:hypothetical protein NXY28_17130 [Bacteroides thetaiotaomicron]|nr:hypothetical protein NXY28_17130 [Bacteroides thetaiotaomicron]
MNNENYQILVTCLIVLLYSTGLFSKQGKLVPDSIASQIPVIQNQAREWKQKIYENPKDEKAWMSYARTIQTLKSLTPGDDIEKEINEMMDKMKKRYPILLLMP